MGELGADTIGPKRRGVNDSRVDLLGYFVVLRSHFRIAQFLQCHRPDQLRHGDLVGRLALLKLLDPVQMIEGTAWDRIVHLLKSAARVDAGVPGIPEDGAVLVHQLSLSVLGVCHDHTGPAVPAEIDSRIELCASQEIFAPDALINPVRAPKNQLATSFDPRRSLSAAGTALGAALIDIHLTIESLIPSHDREIVFRITVDPDNANTVYLGLWTDFDAFPSQGGIYRSSNGGSTWSRLENYPYQDVAMIRFSGNPRRLFVGGWAQDKGSLLVFDRNSFSTVLNQPFVAAITETPDSPTILYAAASATFVRGTGQDAGIYRSTDNGTSWLRLSGNLHHSGIFDLEILPDQPQLLLAASDGDGILVAELDDYRRSFSQFGDGGGISSSVLLINPSPLRSASAELKLFDALGNPLPVELDGEPQQGDLLFNFPPQDLAFFPAVEGRMSGPVPSCWKPIPGSKAQSYSQEIPPELREWER